MRPRRERTRPAEAHAFGSERIALGAWGEALAAQHLEQLRYRILARNWRHGREGELDLIAQDADYVVAVEVKTRTGGGYGHPFESITEQKLGRIRRLLLSWAREHRPGVRGLRIDAVGITLRASEKPRIDVLRGIG